MDLHPYKMPAGISVMRGGTLKLVKMQQRNASSPMLSMPSWRQMGHRRDATNAQSLILLSELGMLIFVIERSHRAKESFPISTRPSPQLHLGQLLPSFKCFSRDGRDGGINPNADYITWGFPSSCVDEDLGINRIAASVCTIIDSHIHSVPAEFQLFSNFYERRRSRRRSRRR